MTPFKQHILTTASERALGRYMRAPDHSEAAAAPATPAAPAAPPAGEAAKPEAREEDSYTGGEVYEAPPEPEGEEKPAAGEGDDGDETVSGDVETPAPADDDGKPKSPAQKRIDELTAARREAERVAAEATRQVEYYKGLAEGRGAKPEGAEQDGDVGEDGPPKPDDYTYGDTDAQYVADLARYETKLAIREERAADEIRARAAKVEADYSVRVVDAKADIADYDDVVTKGADEGKWACSPVVALGIKLSEQGPRVAYHLATNPEESFRIAKLTPLEQAREFGKLEYRMELEAKSKAPEAGGEGIAPTTPNKSATRAPAPIPQVRGSGGRFVAPADTDDFASFEQRADEVLDRQKQRPR